MEIINPIEYPGWNELLLTNENASFFHTSNWAKVLHESYGYTPIYFTEIDDGKLMTLMPFMEVNSFLTGRRAVSLPFTDYCHAIFAEPLKFQDVVKEVIDHGRQAGWKYIEWRGGQMFSEKIMPSITYYGHALDLSSDAEQLLSGFRNSTKRNIEKAAREGVRVEISCSAESIESFYTLNRRTRKDHGLPSQPSVFFNKIYQHIISQEKGFVTLAAYRDIIIAGAVFFNFERQSIFKYAASNKNFLHLRPNNAVLWESIRHLCFKGYETLNLGRTEIENEGLLQYKRGWKPKENEILLKQIQYVIFLLRRYLNYNYVGVHFPGSFFEIIYFLFSVHHRWIRPAW